MVFPARPKTHGPLPGVPGRVDPLPTTVTPAEHLPGTPGRTGHLPSTRPRITSRIPGRPTVTVPGGWIPAGILSAHFTATGTLTATAFQVSKDTAAATATATATATVLAKAKATAAFTASGKLTASIIAIGGGFAVNAPFTATGTATAVAFSQIKRPANFTATATATATTVEREFATAAFSGTATLTATNFARYARAAAFTATGTLRTGNIRVPVNAAFTGTATLSAIARKPYPTITATAQTVTTTGSITNIAVNLSTADVGDTRVVILESYNTSPTTPPSGWTVVARQVNSNMACLAIYRRIKLAGDPDTVTFTVTTTSAAAQCLTIVNCGSLNMFANQNSTSATTVHTTPAVPNTAPGGLAIRAVAYRATVYGQAHTWGAGVTALPTVNTPSGNPDTLSVAWSIQENISAGTAVTATAPASRAYQSFTIVATPPAPTSTVAPARINYAGPVQQAVSGVPLELTAWSNDAGYPLTSSTSRGMVIVGDGPGYFTLNFARNSFGSTFTVTVKADGATIATFGGSSTTNTTVLTNQIIPTSDYVAGTLITYEYTVGTASGTRNPILAGTNLTFTPITAGFTPSGMTKDAATMAMGTASPTQITGVVAESGSTLSGNALIANTSGTTIVRGQVSITGSYGSSYTAELRRNGTAIPGATVSGGDAMGGAPVLVIPPTSVAMAAGDLITMWITNPGSNCTIAGGTGTFVRLTAS